MCGGGGGGPTETTSTVTQSNLPEYAQPYYEDLMARVGFETAQPYQAYGGQRLANFSPMEQEAMGRLGQLGFSGPSAELSGAMSLAANAGRGFNPGILSNARSTYSGGTFSSGNRRAGSRDVQYDPNQYEMGYTAGSLGPDAYYDANQRQMGFDPGSLADEGAVSQYMTPYMQQVVDVEKREAARQADQRHQQLGLDAARQGGLGGYRDAILRAENERNLTQEMSDIQTRGQQAAFANAQQAFEQDRQARAAAEQFGQSQFDLNEGMRQREAELLQQGFSIQEAARQAQEEFGQSAFGMNESVMQALEQFRQGQFGMNEDFSSRAFQDRLGAFIASHDTQRAAAELGLTAAQINQAGQIASAQNRLAQQSNMLGAAGMLGQLDAQRYGQTTEGLMRALQIGGMERGLNQMALDMGYQDFLRQQAFPREQLALYSNILQGVPVQPGTTSATYGMQPSYGQQLLGGGLGALGMYQAFGGGG